MNADHKHRRGRKEGWKGLQKRLRATFSSPSVDMKMMKTLFTTHTRSHSSVQQLILISTKVLVKQDAKERRWGRAQDEIEILFILLNLKTPKFSWRWWRWRKTISSTHTWSFLMLVSVYIRNWNSFFIMLRALSLSEHRKRAQLDNYDDVHWQFQWI